MALMFYCGLGNVVLAICEICNLSCLEDGDFDRIIRAPGNRDYSSKLGNYTLLSGNLGFEIVRQRRLSDWSTVLAQIFGFLHRNTKYIQLLFATLRERS